MSVISLLKRRVVEETTDDFFDVWAELVKPRKRASHLFVERGADRRMNEIRAGYGRRRGENCTSTCVCWQDATAQEMLAAELDAIR